MPEHTERTQDQDQAHEPHQAEAKREVWVMPLVSRYIGDDYYAVGQEAKMDADRARRYVAIGEFRYCDEAAAKAAMGLAADEEPETMTEEAELAAKMRGNPENKDKRQMTGAIPSGFEGQPSDEEQAEANKHIADAQPDSEERAEAEAHAQHPSTRPPVRAADKPARPLSEPPKKD